MPRSSKTAPLNGAVMSFNASTHRVAPPKSASASRDAFRSQFYQARAARGRSRPGDVPVEDQVRTSACPVHAVVDNIITTTNPSAG